MVQVLVVLGASGRAGVVGSLRREQPERRTLLEALGAVYARGGKVEWSRGPEAKGRCVPLPSYAWQRERYWMDTVPASAMTGASSGAGLVRAGGHPLAGAEFTVSTQAGTRFWETQLSVSRVAYLGDHRVGEAVVLPGTAYVEMGLWAAAESFGREGHYELEEVRFREALVLGEAGRRVQVALTQAGPGEGSFRVSSQGEGEAQWTLHASGRVRRVVEEQVQVEALETLRTRLGEGRPTEGYYKELAEKGLTYGPAFQGLRELWSGSGEALGRIEVAPEVLRDKVYRLHPAVLDAALQLAGRASSAGEDAAPSLPVLLSRVRVHRELSPRMWSHVRVSRGAEGEEADIELRDEAGHLVAEVRGLHMAPLGGRQAGGQEALPLLVQRWRKQEGTAEEVGKAGRWLVVLDEGGWGERVAKLLEARGQQVVGWKPAAGGPVEAALEKAFSDEGRGVVACHGLDAVVEEGSGTEAVLGTQEKAFLGVLSLVKALGQRRWRKAPRLWLVTKDSQRVEGGEVSPAQTGLWGLGRTLAVEHPELSCTRVDVSAGGEELLVKQLLAEPLEEEFVLRPGGTYVGRLEKAGSLPRAERREKAGARAFRLELDAPGVLDRMVLRECPVRQPGPGEVLVRVESAGLNFIDVMKAMGIYPGLGDGPIPLGGECSGRIEAVGPGVEGFTIGQPVVAMGPNCFGTHVTTAVQYVAPRPANMSALEAGGVPVTFLTAWYAMHTLGQLRKGERILIHSAASGVGLCAVRIAQRAGARILATAGSEEKRAWLRELGVEHVMDSRSLRFAEEVLEATHGEGVDMVLNSLAGEAIEKSLSVLAYDGRFLELGKKDIYSDDRTLSLAVFRKRISYHAVDLLGFGDRRKERFQEVFRELMEVFERGELSPLPTRTFPVSRTADAFQTMAQGRHIGKLVVDLTEPDVHISVGEGVGGMKQEASYLVTGGLGGLGLSVARWMVEQGARNLVLVGRAGAETEEQRRQVEELRASGTRVEVCRADVGREEEVGRAVEKAEEMGPLKGVVHAAGVLEDGLLEQQSAEKVRKVMGPKVGGAWNLHRATRGRELDFFVLYSSAASLLGSPGQSNYAAANAFMDGLAEYRRARGLPGLSVQWGAFSDVGMAAAQANRGERVAQRGMNNLSPQQGWRALGELLRGEAAQVGVVPLDARQWLEFYPHLATMARFKELLQAGTGQPKGDKELVARLRAASAAELPGMMEALVREQAAAVLRLEPSRIERETPLKALGIDSLMGLELRNRLEARLGVTLSATLAWTYPHVAALTEYLIGRLELAPAPELARQAATAAAAAAERAREETEVQQLQQLSEEEKAALLQEELASLEKLLE
jgi:NADPH:quinone reductase-like Zn-dependent oxidoreductase/acyl carrier protein